MMNEKEDEHHLKTIVRGAGIAFTGLILAKLFAYIYRILIARYFGPADYGLFSIGVAVFTIFSVIMMLGFNSTIVHYVAHFLSKNDEKRVKGIILFAFRVVLPVSALMALFLYVFSGLISSAFFHAPELAPVFRIFSLALPFYSLVLIGSVTFVGFQRIRYKVYADSIISNVLKIVFLVAFASMGLGVAGIASSWLAATIIAGLLSVYYIYRVFPAIRTAKPVYLKKEVLSYAFPLFLTSVMLIVFSYTDIIMLGYFPNVGIVDVGIYSAGVAVAQLLNIMPLALTALFLPVLTKLHAKGQMERFNNTYRTVTRWTFLVNLPASLMMVFFSRQIITIFFGSEFASGSTALALLGVGYLFYSISSIPFLLLNSIKRNQAVLYSTGIALLLNAAFNALLIPIYGIEGAAISVVIANAMRLLLVMGASYYYVRAMPVGSGILKSLASGAVSLTAVNYVSRAFFTDFPIHAMIVLFVGFMAIYLLVFLVLRGLGEEDIRILKIAERRLGIRIGFLRRIIKRFT